MKRKILIGSLIGGGVVITAGAAFALLGGSVLLPDIAQGLAGGTANACQTSAVNFVVGNPVWDGGSISWVINSVDYQGIDPICVTAGDVDLELKITDGYTTLATGTATNMSAGTGTINLTPALDFDTINGADFQYLVVG